MNNTIIPLFLIIVLCICFFIVHFILKHYSMKDTKKETDDNKTEIINKMNDYTGWNNINCSGIIIGKKWFDWVMIWDCDTHGYPSLNIINEKIKYKKEYKYRTFEEWCQKYDSLKEIIYQFDSIVDEHEKHRQICMKKIDILMDDLK